MKFHIRTYGCQMNERDSEAIGALLIKHGNTPTPREWEADLVIVNTCSVRKKAEDKALGKLGLLVAGKGDHPERIVGAMGCMVQRLRNSIFERVPGLDFAVGTHSLSNLPNVVDLVTRKNTPVIDAGDGKEECPDVLSIHEQCAVTAFVNILLGCDRRCSYCVVPSVRGQEWSRPAEHILEEIREMVSSGVREVTLLGQSVMSYGRRNEVWPNAHASPRGFKEPLARLLEAVNTIQGIERIRFTSGHPSGCTPELVQAMAELPAVCGHLHLPLQSGSDRILKMMRRGYTVDDYRRAAARLRKTIPGIALTTDVIVGFPSESAEDFDMTRKIMAEISFDNSFIFKYSSRPNTAAAEWNDTVSPEEKLIRNKNLLAEQNKRSTAINRELIGTVVEVLATGCSKRNPSRWSGRTRTNKIVVFEPPEGIRPGTTLKVDIERAGAQTLYGIAIPPAPQGAPAKQGTEHD